MEQLISNRFIIDGTAEIVLHHARFQILEFLGKKKVPQFVDQISKGTGIHPRMVSHHLDVLEEKELIRSEYKIIDSKTGKRGVAVRMCELLPKAREVISELKKSFSEGL